MKKHIGLLFGSFNPIHLGHVIIANYMVSFTDIDEVWFVISPHNPHKDKANLLSEQQRFEMVYRAIEKYPKLKASNIEFALSQPSYTVHTLAYLEEKFPEKKFSLIMGADNLNSLSNWYNYEVILENYRLYVYPRPGCELGELQHHKNVQVTNSPVMEISSSFIRESVKKGFDISYLMPIEAFNYLDEMNFYK
ncbi:MAG TPA: nicotinic acid mononucleotide adenylyltransferase [Bacteroidales bacterium]|nr:nicotinic acid mononucleotide adenylyltransferase [Bacteroidales bacterium]